MFHATDLYKFLENLNFSFISCIFLKAALGQWGVDGFIAEEVEGWGQINVVYIKSALKKMVIHF